MSPVVHAQGLGRLSEQVLNTLKQDLESGVFARNDRLPTEKELCERFKTSRNTLRRAIARLEADGWLEVRQGAGTFVRRTGPEVPASKTISVMFPFDSESLMQVQQATLDQGYLMCVFTHHDWSPATERMFLERVLAENHRGLLAFCTPLQPRNEDLLSELVSAGVRVVHVEHFDVEPPEQSHVLPDYVRGGYMAATTLMVAGYKQLRFVSLENDGPYARILEKGFTDAVRDYRPNGEKSAQYVALRQKLESDPASRKHFEAFIKSIKPSTGLVLRSPDMADYIVPALQDRGLKVPEDVGIISVRHLLNTSQEGIVDRIDYDWVSLLHRAIEAVVRPNWQEVREWIQPTLVRRGSVRVPVM